MKRVVCSNPMDPKALARFYEQLTGRKPAKTEIAEMERRLKAAKGLPSDHKPRR